MSIGTCYGFGIDSDLQFQFLRGGEGQRLEVIVSDVQPDATGAALVQEWSSADGTSPLARLYARDGVYLLWSFAVGWLTIDPHAPSISVPHTPFLISREQITLITATLLCFHARGDVGLHACSVDIGGEAIVFAAPGKFGKT